jgi:CheY-like chemotaxis protein
MVLSAVLANASEAIEGQGKIRIECSDVQIAPDERPGEAFPLSPGSYVCLSVRDSGRGMDEGTRRRIFEPFFTTKFQGRGMGMPAVYGVVRNHGGWISVDSAPGEGTTVRICLPAARAPEPAQGKAEMQKPNRAGLILLIEDEPMVMQVNRALLESLGYRVLSAETGDQALRAVRSEQGAIDLVILDVVLPDMEARELYSLLMEARPLLKVLVCSGYSVHGPVQEVLDLGAQGFIQKPFTLKQLSAELGRVMQERKP